MRRAAPTLAAIGLGLALVAAPTAARADDEADRREAKALVREGNRLLQDAQDPAGALSLFVAAYAKFPSDKILVSIGSAERALGHDGAAANAYARFVASPDATADQAREARKLLATLDSKLGRVTVTVTPATAELQLGDGRWEPAAALAEWRAAPGPLVIRARAAGFVDGEATVTIARGKVVTATLALAAVPVEVAPPPDEPPPDEPPPSEERPPGSAPRLHRFGLTGKVIIDGKGRGAGGVVGAVIGLGPVAIDLGAIIGPTFGAYGGLRLALGRARVRPVLGLGVPVFFDDGTRVGARAAGGLEYRLSPQLRMAVEIGAEYMLTRADDIDRWLLAPALSAEARL